MQTTLLGLAIAIILALVAALVGPYVIDWGRFRPQIEAEAGRLLGAPVRVTGPIQGALLPTPSLTLRGIEIGAADDNRPLRARTLGIEFSLGFLIRGEWRAAEMHLVGPEFNLGLNSSGQLTAPKIAVGFDPDALSIDHLNIEDAHATFTDARSGSRLVLDKLWFNGDFRSLSGPFKGDGAFVIAGELYAYRIAAGRIGDDGAAKLRFNIDPSDRALAIDGDGALSFERGEPRFEGSFNVARPTGLSRANGQTVVIDPWRLSARIKATTAAALLEQVEFQYGPEERAAKLTGTAELKFGDQPRFEGVLSARQIDLDRALTQPDGKRRLPLAAIKILSEMFSGAWRPSIPARLGIGIDAVSLGGATIQAVRGDLTTDGTAWNLEDFEFRAPGFTQFNLSGRLDVAAKPPGFTGPVSLDSSDPSALVDWLEGVSETSASRMRPLRARGEVTLGGEKIAVDRLRAEIDRKTVEGRLAYGWATDKRPARLDAELSAAEVDIDALLAFANAVRGGTSFEMPREGAIGIDIGRATIAGVEARQLTARLRRDARGLQVERFSVADLGGAAFDVSGQVETGSPSPRGKMDFALDARKLDGVVALAAKFAPNATGPLRRLAESLPAAKLNASLSLDGVGAGTAAKLAIEGRSGAMRLSLLGETSAGAADLTALSAANVHLQGNLEADDGGALIELLQLNKMIAVDKQPGQLNVVANGPLGGDLSVEGRLRAGGLDASAKGSVKLAYEGPKGDLRLSVAAADVRPLRRGAGEPLPLPVTLDGDVVVSSSTLDLNDFSGTFAGTGVRGRLGFTFALPLRIEGRVEADNVEVPAALAAAIGAPARADGAPWPPEPFAPGLLNDLDARIEFTAAQAAVAPALVLRQMHGMAKFNRSEIALTDVEGVLADGRITGQLVFDKSGNAISARGRIALTDADAALLLPSEPPPVAGRLAVRMEVEGSGLSAATLIGSLAGNGTVALERGQLAGLDPKAFDAAARAVDQGMAPDAAKTVETVNAALQGGSLAVASAEGVITIAAGQMRLTNTIAQAEGADLTLAANVDLIEGMLNARLALAARTEKPVSSLERPVIVMAFKGPVADPKRTTDFSALTAWLTLRSVEQQAKRLEAIETAPRESALGTLPAPMIRSAPRRPATPTAAPPLPPPIDIRSPQARVPAHSGAGTARKPAKPPTAASPSASRPPLDLSVNPQN